ncbi:hypothetical protein vseg_009907 [Gypsophila vaccaria]
MATREEESSALHESCNAVNEDNALSEGTCCDANDVSVKVEVVVPNVDVDVGAGGHECGDHGNDEGALVQELDKLELRSNVGDGSKVEEEKSDGECNGDGAVDDSEVENRVYPLKPYVVDCSFYTKTGTCKFGQNCRYNHSSRKVFKPVGDKEKRVEGSIELVDDAGKIECKYYQQSGGCKYGNACRYNHSARKIEKEYLLLNFLGLPIRPTAEECAYYLKHGSCAYGANCRFNHPEPSAVKEYESEGSLGNGISTRAGVDTSGNYDGLPMQSFDELSQGTSMSPNGINLRNGPAYAPPEMSSYHQTTPQSPGLHQSQANSSPSASKFRLPHELVNNVSKRVAPVSHYENPMQIEEFPERPGQLDCDYFMKNGNCKYRSACRYNHPRRQMSKLSLPPPSSKSICSRPPTMLPTQGSRLHYSNSGHMGNNGMSSSHHQVQQMQNGEFPERAGQPECKYYMKTGQCKYKSACRYDHPRTRLLSSLHCDLNEKGLPLRPGAKLCRNYEQQGKCKYGLNCLYDHPDDHTRCFIGCSVP